MPEDGDRLKKAKAKAGRYCALGERSPKQVRDKLISYGLRRDEAEQVLQDLLRNQLVDEHRFARAFANDKFKFNKWGKLKIRTELRLKHQISEAGIEQGLEYIHEDEYQEMVHNLLSRRLEKLDPVLDRHQKMKKCVDFVLRKGFEMDLVMKIYKELSP